MILQDIKKAVLFISMRGSVSVNKALILISGEYKN